MLARIMGITITQPYCAPAFVDNTKWEVPIAILANKSPGPKFLNMILSFDTISGLVVPINVNYFG